MLLAARSRAGCHVSFFWCGLARAEIDGFKHAYVDSQQEQYTYSTRKEKHTYKHLCEYDNLYLFENQ